MKIIVRLVVVAALFAGFGIYRLNELGKIPVKVENFSTYNLVEIYILGALMSVLAYPIYPEIAIEHLSLYSKKKVDRRSKFFLESEVVMKAIHQYTKPTVLRWSGDAYIWGNSEARVALALNGGILIKNENRIIIKVPIRYPRNYIAKLLPMIEVQEGLFWVLQQKGWDHSGEMRWFYDLPSSPKYQQSNQAPQSS